MESHIISRNHAKTARYLTTKWLGKSGVYTKCGDMKVRAFHKNDAEGITWTELKRGSDAIEVEVATLKGDLRNDPTMAQVLDILRVQAEVPHSDIADAVKCAVEFINNPAEVHMEVHMDAACGEDHTAYYKLPEANSGSHKRSVHEMLIKCATMRLARRFGMDINTPFEDIAKDHGADATKAYQEILSKVPAYGLTEARLRFAFPAEMAFLK